MTNCWRSRPDSNRHLLDRQSRALAIKLRLHSTPVKPGGCGGNRTPYATRTAGLRPAALPTEHRTQNGGRWRNRTPLAFHQSTVFRTVRRPFSGTFQLGGSYWSRTSSGFHLYGLANRCIPVLPTIPELLVGMERFELSRAKALVSKTSVSPISTTSPQLSDLPNLDTHQVTEFISTNSSANGGPPGIRTLKMTQLLRLSRLPVPPGAHKAKAPRFLEGLGGL